MAFSDCWKMGVDGKNRGHRGGELERFLSSVAACRKSWAGHTFQFHGYGKNQDRHGDGCFAVTIRKWLIDVEMKKTKSGEIRGTPRRRWQRIHARVKTAFPHDGMPK